MKSNFSQIGFNIVKLHDNLLKNYVYKVGIFGEGKNGARFLNDILQANYPDNKLAGNMQIKKSIEVLNMRILLIFQYFTLMSLEATSKTEKFMVRSAVQGSYSMMFIIRLLSLYHIDEAMKMIHRRKLDIDRYRLPLTIKFPIIIWGILPEGKSDHLISYFSEKLESIFPEVNYDIKIFYHTLTDPSTPHYFGNFLFNLLSMLIKETGSNIILDVCYNCYQKDIPLTLYSSYPICENCMLNELPLDINKIQAYLRISDQ